jgi:hypothetical protein
VVQKLALEDGPSTVSLLGSPVAFVVVETERSIGVVRPSFVLRRKQTQTGIPRIGWSGAVAACARVVLRALTYRVVMLIVLSCGLWTINARPGRRPNGVVIEAAGGSIDCTTDTVLCAVMQYMHG